MAMISRTMGVKVEGSLTVADAHAILNEFPDSADLSIRTNSGDRRDVREAGSRQVVFEASWQEQTNFGSENSEGDALSSPSRTLSTVIVE